jgi:hypothetical protein
VRVRKRLPHAGELLEQLILEVSAVIHIFKILFEYILCQRFFRANKSVRLSSMVRRTPLCGSS